MTTAYTVGLEYFSRVTLYKRLFLVLVGFFFLTGIFAQEYSLSTSTSGNGSILKDPDQPTYTSGTSVELTADPDLGWSFDSWSVDLSGSVNPETLLMDGDKTVAATFAQDQYTLTINTVGTGSVSLNPDQPTYVYNTGVQLTATTSPGWTFAGWTGDVTSTDNPLNHTMVGDLDLTATFTEDQYTISVTPVGTGSVSLNPDQPTYVYNTGVQLTATTSPGWTFAGWTGDVTSTDNPLNHTMVGDLDLTATFEEVFDLNITPLGNGGITVVPDLTTYPDGTEVTITATADPGWTFTGWSDGLTSTDNPLIHTMVADLDLTATFTQDQYTIGITPDGTGSVSLNPDQPTYVYNTGVQLTATTSPGWTFAGWTGDVTSTDNPLNHTMVGDLDLTATFTEDQYTISITPDGTGSVSLNPDQPTYVYNTGVQLTATASPGWTFAGWTGDVTSTDNPLNHTMVGNLDLTATFTEDQYTISVTPVGTGSVSLNPDQPTYVYNTGVQLTATTSPGWTFAGWTGDVISTDNPLNHTMVGDLDLTATFTEDQYTISVTPVGTGDLSLNPDQPTYVYNTGVQLTATTSPGWTFAGWTGDVTSTDNPLNHTMVGDLDLTATFEEVFDLNITPLGNGGITVVPDLTTYPDGTEVTITATADPGWTFTGWSDGLTSTDNPLIHTMVGDLDLTATFTEDQYTISITPDGTGSVSLNPDQPTYVYNTGVQLTATTSPGWTFAGWTGDVTSTDNPLNHTMVGDLDLTATFTEDQYTISITPDGTGSVSLNPDQPTYVYNTGVQLTATASPGWTFAGWTGDVTSTDNPLNHTMVGDLDLTATFTEDQYTISVTPVGTGSVSVNPDQPTYIYNTGVQLTATASPGWTFAGWTGDVTSTDNPLNHTMVGDLDITATFTEDQYTISITPDGTGSVSLNPDQPTYVYNTGVQLTATTSPGWTFAGWAGDVTSTDNPLNHTMVGDLDLTATFTEDQYAISITPVGTGSVSVNPDQPTYIYNTGVQLTATASPGWTFAGWTGDVTSTDNPLNHTMVGDLDLTATFTEDQYTISITPDGTGSVSLNPDQPTYVYNTGIQLTATASPGWTFAGWTGDVTSTDNPLNHTMVGNLDLTATFTEDQYAISITPVGTGSVSVNPDQPTYIYNTGVQLTATASPGWTFAGWTGDVTSTDNPLNHTMVGDLDITATFTEDQYTISITPDGTGSVSVNPDQPTYVYNTGVQLTATASPGWTFAGWTGDVTSTDNPLNHTMVGDLDLTATFTEDQYTISITPDGTGSVSVNPDQPTYVYNTGVQLTATASPGWTFAGWTGDVTSTDNPLNHTMVGDLDLTATFTEDQYTISITPDGTGSVSVNPDQPTYIYNTGVQLTATALPGWTFAGWTGDVTSTDNPLNHTMVGNLNLTATFTEDQYAISITPVGTGSVSVNPDQPTYIYNTGVQLTATASPGWTFAGWTGDVTSTDNPLNHTMVGDLSVIATFTQDEYTLTINTVGVGTVAADPAQATYYYGDEVDLTATAAIGWIFTGWSGDLGGSVNPETLTMDGNKTVTATFTQIEYTLTINIVGSGVVEAEPLQATYNYGDEVDLLALPAAGWSLDSWSGGGLSGNLAAALLTIVGNTTVTATFTQDEYTLTINTVGNGTVDVAPVQATYNYGDEVDLTATAATGWTFDSWSGGGLSGNANPETLTILGNTIVTATFTQDEYALTINTVGSGTVAANPAQPTYYYGTDVGLTATPAAGWNFVGWTGDLGGSVNPATISMDGNKSVTATFQLNTYQLSLQYNPAGASGAVFTPSSPVTVTHGIGQSISVTIPAGYDFTGWTITSGSAVIANAFSPATTVTLNSGDATLQANFELKTYQLTMISDGTPGVSFTPSSPRTFQHGITQTISVSVPGGYAFGGWTTLIGNADVNQQFSTTTQVTLYNGNATLVANFVKIVAITNVTIPNATMRIGDVVSATIEVVTDAGITYSLLSGSIGGYNLYGLQRINSTTYLANFDVTSGGGIYYPSQNIPVSNLVLTDGTNQNAPYNLPIVQNNDLLDGQPPIIEGISVVGGLKKIGDEVTININSDASGYSIHPNTSINGKLVGDPDIYFDDLGSGNYRLRYYVQEGDNDVGYGDLVISVILIKPSGNTNAPQTFLENRGGIAIDANRPVITRMEVPSLEYGPDLTVQITVTADGSGYQFGSGTIANGVPLSSSRLSGSEHSGGLYDLSYVVSTSDQNVSPGSLQGTVVLIDPAGNTSAPYSVMESNSLEVYTTRPTAVLAGTPVTCSGDPAQLTVFLQGRSPWVLELDDGSEITRYESVTSNEFTINVFPSNTTTYSISSVWDRNGVGNFSNDNVEVLVNQKTPVEIINLASGYSITDDPVELEATIPGGVFSGPGVISTTGYFYPDIADTVNSPHSIVYAYLNDNGCTSTDSKLVFVLGAEGDIFIPESTVCADSEPFIVNASNIAGTIGSFALLNESNQPVAGLTDLGDNSATVNPMMLPSGLYTVEYTYFDEVTLVLKEAFQIESIDTPEITSLSDTYCQSENPVAIVTSVPGATVVGPGVTGNLMNGFIFDPAEADVGSNTLISTITTEYGCSRSVQKFINVRSSPEVYFDISTTCIPIEGGYIEFSNLSGDKLNVSSWLWDFDDVGSGTENQSTLANPVHLYQESGQRNISLTATTNEGCTGTYILDTLFGKMPVADMTWDNDCYSEETGVEFFNSSEFDDDPIGSSKWTFRTMDGQQIGETINSVEPVSINFPGMETYRIDLQVTSTNGCSDSVTKELVLRPTYKLGPEPYLEDFNNSNGRWTIHSENQIESWVWGEPDFDGYVDSLSNKAWYTQLLSSSFDMKENSWLQSPCFDFTEMKRPLIQLDIMRSFVPRINGAVIQYRDGAEGDWITLGSETPGINWYNLDNILNLPGGSRKGWGLEVFNPDREWVRAMHDLDDLVGKPGITFRVSIATNGAVGMGNEGFAWDNFSIAERSKVSVLEYFTNSSDTISMGADNLVDSISLSNSGDVIDLQYHMDFPGTDPMNSNNPFPASTRSFYYGVPSVPYAILNGGNSNEFRYDFASIDSVLGKGHIQLVSLEIPEFKIELSVSWNDEALETTTEITCLEADFSDNIQLYLVVFESSVTAYTGSNGDNRFRNVVLDMLPNPAGKLLGNEWKLDSTISIANAWPYASYVEDIEDLAIVAFLQDRNSGRIIQSVVKYSNETVDIRPTRKALPALHTYPNPVQHSFYINLGRIAENNGNIQLIDMNGRVVMIEQVPPGYQIYQMDISHLDRGLYILQWFESGQLYGMHKIIKVR